MLPLSYIIDQRYPIWLVCCHSLHLTVCLDASRDVLIAYLATHAARQLWTRSLTAFTNRKYAFLVIVYFIHFTCILMCVLFPDEIRLYCAVFTFTDNDIESTFNTRCNNGCLLLIDGMVGASDSWDF